MYNLKKPVLIFLLGICFFSSASQVNPDLKLDIRLEADPPNIDLSAIVESCRSLFFDYAILGTLLDSKGAYVRSSIGRFRRLFETNSIVWNDLKKQSEVISHHQYVALLEIFENSGLSYDIQNAFISRIEDRDDFYYIVIIQFDKLMKKGLDHNDVPIIYKKSELFQLSMKIIVSKENMENSAIITIECPDCKTIASHKESFAGTAASFGIPIINGNLSSYMIGSYPALENMIQDKYQISFGIDYLRNFSGESMWYWNIALRYKNLKADLNSDIDLIYSQIKSYDNVVKYNRIVEIKKGATEEINLKSISLPLGLFYRYNLSRKNFIFLGLNLIPSYHIGIDHIFRGQFLRSMHIDDYKISGNFTNDLGSNCNGEAILPIFPFSNSKGSINLAWELSARYKYKYRYNNAIGLQLSYGSDILPFLDNPQSIFLGENYLPQDSYNENTSLTQTIFSDLKSALFGFSISWHYVFKSKGLLY